MPRQTLLLSRPVFGRLASTGMALLIAIASAGCVPAVPNYFAMDSPTVSEAVEIDDDPFQSIIRYIGPLANFRNGDLNMGAALRGWRGRQSGEITGHQLYIFVIYTDSDLRRYRRASYLGGSPAEVVEIDWDVLSCRARYNQCSYSETFGVMLSDDFLRDHAYRGFSIQVSSRTGHRFVASVPQGYLRGYLDAVDGP